MKVLINGHKVNLNPRDVIGVGGEATVIRHGSEAVKIYHAPSGARERKLCDFVQVGFALPPEVIAPQALAHHPQDKRVIGFTMPLLGKDHLDVGQLANKHARLAFSIGARDVADLFMHGHETLWAIHHAGLVVGDLNDCNTLFTLRSSAGSHMAFIDVDSFQFGPHPCMVGTEGTLDPLLYGVDLSLRPVFRPENDWYSYTVLLFRALTLAHPYGGVHPGVKTLLARAQARIPVWDSGVRYPKIALPLGVLSDDLLAVFERFFAGGWRGVFPLEALRDYHDGLITCPDCGAQYPRSRAHCPLCSTVTALPTPARTHSERGFSVHTWLEARGPIVYCTVQGSDAVAVAHEGGRAVLLRADGRNAVRRLDLFEAAPGARYALFGSVLAVSPDPAQKTLFLLDVSGDQPQGLERTSTDCFAGEGAIFGAAGRGLYRLAGGYLLRGVWQNGLFAERTVTAVSDGQTWFTVAPGEPEIVFGYFRSFNRYDHFLIADGQRHEVALPPLDHDEALEDIHAAFADGMAFALRQTRQRGVRYVRRAEVGRDGEIVYADRLKLSDAPAYAHLRGLAYRPGIVLHPTDDGIVQEHLRSGQERVFSATADIIQADDRLIPFDGGLLVVKADRVLRLTLG